MKHSAQDKKNSVKYGNLRWLKRRVEILERDKERCQGFNDDGTQCDNQPLEVHHRNRTTTDYRDEPSENLISLCRNHHEQESNFALSQAAAKVCAVLKKSNWMVEQRKLLARCISEKIISPEEFCRIVEDRLRGKLRSQ
jgi:hypothetical protein